MQKVRGGGGGRKRGGVVELGHFDKHFIKTTKRKGPTGNILKFFLLGILKTTFWMDNLTQRLTQSSPFFPKSERMGEVSPLPSSWAPVRVAEYASIIYLNILENPWINCSDLARALNIHDLVTCLTSFSRCLGF